MTYLGGQKPWEAVKAQLFLKLRLISRFLFFSPSLEPGGLRCLSNLDCVSASFL